MKRILPLLLLLVLLAPEAAATSVRPFSLHQLFREADLIVLGKVTGEVSFWNGAHDTIYTDYTVAVESTRKGLSVDTVVVRLMGGTVGPTTLSVAGNAIFAVGERVLLVLRNQGDFHTLVGMSQGKWSVWRSDGIDVVRRGPPSTLSGTISQPSGKPLSELLEQLQPPPNTTREGEVVP